MKIAIASDHAGYAEKERLKPLLDELGLDVDDLGTASEESVYILVERIFRVEMCTKRGCRNVQPLSH